MLLPIESRRDLLKQALQKVGYPVIQSTAFDVKPADLVRAAKELELEGVIAKRKGSPYEPGRRSGVWLKYKNPSLSRVRDRRLHGRGPVRRAHCWLLREQQAVLCLSGESRF